MWTLNKERLSSYAMESYARDFMEVLDSFDVDGGRDTDQAYVKAMSCWTKKNFGSRSGQDKFISAIGLDYCIESIRKSDDWNYIDNGLDFCFAVCDNEFYNAIAWDAEGFYMGESYRPRKARKTMTEGYRRFKRYRR